MANTKALKNEKLLALLMPIDGGGSGGGGGGGGWGGGLGHWLQITDALPGL